MNPRRLARVSSEIRPWHWAGPFRSGPGAQVPPDDAESRARGAGEGPVRVEAAVRAAREREERPIARGLPPAMTTEAALDSAGSGPVGVGGTGGHAGRRDLPARMKG